MPLEVRAARPDDAAAVREVSARAHVVLRRVYRPTAEAIAARTARDADRACLVALSDGAVAGYLEYEREREHWHLLGPMVDPAQHRRGIARALVERLAELARAAGATELALVTIEQTGNVAIFEALGFRAVGRTAPRQLESATGAPITEIAMTRTL